MNIKHFLNICEMSKCCLRCKTYTWYSRAFRWEETGLF